MYTLYRGHRKLLDPLKLKLQADVSCHAGAGELNPGPVEEQQALLISEPSLQSPLPPLEGILKSLWTSILSLLRGYSKTHKAHTATSETGRKPPLASDTHNWNKPEAHRVLLPEEEKPTQESPKFRGLGSCPKKEGLRLERLYQEVGTIQWESNLI